MGKVYLLGAGPGDPELLTLKALRILEKAEVVLYDHLVSAEILALANPAALLIHTGKRHGEQEAIQNEINELMLHHASLGRTVVRLKSGDPMVFSRGAEEWALLRMQGSTSAISCRGIASSFAVITEHNQKFKSPEWAKFQAIETLVVLMGFQNRSTIATELIFVGRPHTQPFAFVERGLTDRERVVESTLEKVASGEVSVSSPAVWVIGEVVRMRSQLAMTPQEVLVAC